MGRTGHGSNERCFFFFSKKFHRARKAKRKRVFKPKNTCAAVVFSRGREREDRSTRRERPIPG